MVIDPPGDLVDIESHELPDLHERNAPFVDQTSDVADGDTQVVGHRVDVDQRWEVRTRPRMEGLAGHDGPIGWADS